MNYKWVILSFLTIFTIILGCIGFNQAALSGNLPDIKDPTIADFFFLSLRLFSLQTVNLASNPTAALQVARILAPAITFCTLILVVTSNFFERFAIFWIGNVKRDHVIVCGLGYLGPVITKTLLARGYSVVVIERDPDNPELDSVRDLGALIVNGDAANKDTLNRAQISYARGLFAVTGDDAKNISIYTKCDDRLTRNDARHPFNCYIHIEDRNLYRIYDSKNLGKFIPGGKNAIPPGLHRVAGEQTFFFNLYWSAATCLLQRYPFILPEQKDRLAKRMEIPLPAGNPVLEKQTVPDPEPPELNILVAGVGTLGESLILEAAFEWWIWFGHTDKKLNLILVDKDAEEKAKLLTARYPLIKNYCHFDTIKSDVLSSEVTEGAFLFNPDKTPKVNHIYICFADETLALTAAVRFRKLLDTANVPIVFRTIRDEMLNALIQQHPDKDPAHWHLSAFPIAACECCMNEILYHGADTRLAIRIHQNYLTQEFRKGQTLRDNPNLVPWKDLSHEMHESNRRQAAKFAMAIIRRGYSIEPLHDWTLPLTRFAPEDVEILAEEEHKSWLAEKRGLGYSYGPEKSDKKKTHPCILEWPDLPDDERIKDRDAIRALPRLFAEIGQRVVKR